MSAIFSGRSNLTSINSTSSLIHPVLSSLFSTISLSSTPRSLLPKFSTIPYLNHSSRPKNRIICSSSKSVAVDEWLDKLPDKEKPLYAHSLPSVEAWLKSLGFHQSKEDRSVWFVEKLDWHAQLSLDVTDLCIRYLKSGPGNLEKDMERRFSYALSREDIENAILGGP